MSRPPTGPDESRLQRLVHDLHATPQTMVMAFAGAGAQALAWLHGVGGSSRTVLEAVDLYDDRAMIDWVGFTPARFTSKRVARAMAETAWRRARELTARRRMTPSHPVADAEPGTNAIAAPVFGLACTASIATDRPKKGEHRVVVAVRDGFGTALHALTLVKGARDRAGEEHLVSQLILRAVADACGVLDRAPLPLVEGERLEVALEPSPLLAEFDAGERPYVVVRADGTVTSELPDAGREGAPRLALLSGAFNPVHEGHLELANVAAQHIDGGHARPVFELPLVNADKSAIDLFEGRRRAQQFAARAPVVLTREPLFVGKARLFPGCVFVVGADTAQRIVNPRYYEGGQEGLRAALQVLMDHDTRCLVAGRALDRALHTIEDIPVPAGYEELFEGIRVEAFRKDVSSSELRARWVGEP